MNVGRGNVIHSSPFTFLTPALLHIVCNPFTEQLLKYLILRKRKLISHFLPLYSMIIFWSELYNSNEFTMSDECVVLNFCVYIWWVCGSQLLCVYMMSVWFSTSVVYICCQGLTLNYILAQSAGAVEYTDCTSAEREDSRISVLDMTLNNMMVSFQWCWSFGECGALLHFHCSQVHSGPDKVLSMG